MNKYLAFLLIILASSFSNAATLKCDVISKLRCACPASTMIRCEGIEGTVYLMNTASHLIKDKKIEIDESFVFADKDATKKIVRASEDYSQCEFMSVVRKVTYHGSQACVSFIKCGPIAGSAGCGVNNCSNPTACANDKTVDIPEELINSMICMKLSADAKLSRTNGCTPQGTVITYPSINYESNSKPKSGSY